jgi:hypothetical protein
MVGIAMGQIIANGINDRLRYLAPRRPIEENGRLAVDLPLQRRKLRAAVGDCFVGEFHAGQW